MRSPLPGFARGKLVSGPCRDGPSGMSAFSLDSRFQLAEKEEVVRRIPSPNDEGGAVVQAIFLCVWVGWCAHYGLISEVKDGSYQGQELGDYIKSKANIQATKYHHGSISKSKPTPQLVLLPFFRDSETRLETELNRISSDKAAERRRSVLYSALRELLERLGNEK
jgi:hypothetical protein